MYAIEVIPISRGILKERLTYFSAKDIPLGSIAEVPLRNRKIKALITGKKNIAEEKIHLKKADFALKKINAVRVKNFLPSFFIESAEETAKFFASTTGALLNNLIPKNALENSEKLKFGTNSKNKPKRHHEKLVVQAGEEERFTTYRNLIREEFAKNSSVLFIAPTLEDVNKSKKILEKGIEDFTFCFNSSLGKKDFQNTWNKSVSTNHPVLIIATAQFMCIPRKDFNVLILEKENSSAYKQIVRPYMDIRTFAEIFAKKSGARLIVGDILLRTETVWRQKNLEFAELTPLKFRSLSGARQFVATLEQKEKQKEFFPISEELVKIIEIAQNRKEQVFVFGARKGLYPMLSCGDCGETVNCPNCSAPLALHEKDEIRTLLCHKCGVRKKVAEKCGNCQGWRLQTLGVGIELIEKEIRNIFPKAEIFRLDKESASTPKKARTILEKFHETPSGILIGSEMALFYLQEKIDNVICASVDSLLSIPDFRINEKILSILLKLRSLSRNTFLLQTRLPDLKLWDYLTEGNLVDFYREELETRRLLGYPPFSVLIKITIQSSKKETAQEEAEKTKALLQGFDSIVYPSFISKLRGKYLMNVLLKIDPKNWPNENLISKLLSLPPKYMIKVDPENIL